MRAIVNLSTKKYWPGQIRLVRSLRFKTDATLFLYRSEEDVESPEHKDNPYAFKIHAIEKALEAGYEQVLWLDASMYAVKDLSPIFKHIEREGYFFQNSEWLNERLTNLHARNYFGTSEGWNISSGCVGLDFRNNQVKEFFKRWKQSMIDGIFKGSWEDHRHDQTCASLIAYKMGLKISPKDTFFQYITEPPIKENILLIVDGIC
jgi:hypothetical protein